MLVHFVVLFHLWLTAQHTGVWACALFVNKAIHHEARALIASYRYSFSISFAARSIIGAIHQLLAIDLKWFINCQLSIFIEYFFVAHSIFIRILHFPTSYSVWYTSMLISLTISINSHRHNNPHHLPWLDHVAFDSESAAADVRKVHE